MQLQGTVREFEHEIEKGFNRNVLIGIFFEVEQRFNEESAEVTVETSTEE